MSNIFSRILGSLSGAFSRQPTGSVVAIDFGASSVKAIQLRRERGRVLLETYGELATGPYVGMAVGQAVNLGVDKMAEVLIDLLREANVTATTGIISIPLRSSLLITVQIPAMSGVDLASAVPNEARRFIPVPISEVTLDWWLIPERQDESPAYDQKIPGKAKTNEVLIAAIHRDTFNLYQDLAKRLSLNVDTYEIETFSLIRSVLANDLSATAIVDFGAGTTKVAIVDYGVVRLSHTINRGAQDISLALSRSLAVSFDKAEEIKRQVGLVEEVSEQGEVKNIIDPIVEYIFEEIRRVMVDYQKKHQVAIDKVILLGGGSQLRGLPELAAKALEVKVEAGTPFDRMETPAFLDTVLKQAGPSFAVAIGLALRKLENLS